MRLQHIAPSLPANNFGPGSCFLPALVHSGVNYFENYSYIV